MMEDLLKYPETTEFLANYPKAKWKVCLEAVYIYGIFCIKRDFANGLSVTELMKLAGKDTEAQKYDLSANIKLKPEMPKFFLKQISKNPSLSREDPFKSMSSININESEYHSSFLRKEDSLMPSILKHSSALDKNKLLITEPPICSIDSAQRILGNRQKTLSRSSSSKLNFRGKSSALVETH